MMMGYTRPTYLILFGVLDVHIVVDLYGRHVGRVDNVGDGLLLSHNVVVVAAIGGQEDRLALSIVPGDVAHDTTEAGGRERVHITD